MKQASDSIERRVLNLERTNRREGSLTTDDAEGQVVARFPGDGP